MKPDIRPYRRLENLARSYGRIQGGSFLKLSITKMDIYIYFISFFLGRAWLLGDMMPFGAAIYAATMGFDISRLIVAGCIVLGMVSRSAGVQVYTTIAAMLLFNAFNIPFAKVRKRTGMKYAITAFSAVLLPELLMVYLQGFLLYDLIKAVFNAGLVFAMVFVFRTAIAIFSGGRQKLAFSSEELISLVIMLALALTGLSDIGFAGFSLKNIACILVIITISFRCGPGVGAAIGVTVGLIVSMSAVSTPLVIGSFALCGLLAGIFRSLGKIGAGLGFIMGSIILTLYMGGSGTMLPYLKDIVTAVVMFYLIPQKVVDLATGGFYKDTDIFSEKRGYSLRIKELTVEKLKRFSRTFRELSKTFGEISETTVVADKQDISILFDRVADKICKDCSLCAHCWDRNFYNTYQVMFKIVEKLDAKGRIEEQDVPGYFLERCERIYDFVKEVNNIYELFKVDMVWKSRITESRELVSQQMEGLSRVISNLAAEIDVDVHFKSELEDEIVLEFNKEGMRVSEVIVFENKWGKYEVSVFHKGCGGNRKCISTIERVVSSIVGRRMTKESSECYKNSSNNSCALKLVEEEVYKVTTGIARLTKHNSSISGDSYTFMSTGDGKYIIALSDGMGSGQKAAKQSRATISLIEQFMESGFDKDTTIKLINSILVLKSSDDTYSTIDLAVLDLYTGETEFVKVGAVPTLIKRKESVETVRSASLPAGILSNIETELVHKKVGSGDFIIMMTDGVADAFNKFSEEETLQEFVQNIQTINPQTMADGILDRVYEKCAGEPIDDMIVAVAKIWKRAE